MRPLKLRPHGGVFIVKPLNKPMKIRYA
ncbi:MAG: hypothetical protein RL303_179, partial [Verrucomicrobiota bacterium]